MTPFDPAPGLIAPDFEQLSLHLPTRCLFAFLSEARIERFVRGKGGTPLGRFASITKSFPIYELPTPDGPIALRQAVMLSIWKPQHSLRAPASAGRNSHRSSSPQIRFPLSPMIRAAGATAEGMLRWRSGLRQPV